MRIIRCIILFTIVLAQTCMPGLAVEKLPVDLFTLAPQVSNMKISPSGKYALFALMTGDQRGLVSVELDEFSIKTGLPPNRSDISPSFQWADDEHILFQLIDEKMYPGAFYSLNRSLWDETRILPPKNKRPSFGWMHFKTVSVLGIDQAEHLAYCTTVSDYGGLRPDLLAVDYRNGDFKLIDTGASQTMTRWLCDSKGQVRLKCERNFDQLLINGYTAIYERTESGASWTRLLLPGNLEPIRYVNADEDLLCYKYPEDESDGLLPRFNTDPTETFGYVLYNLETKFLRYLEAEKESYNNDEEGSSDYTTYGGEFITTSPDKKLAGVQWLEDKPRVKWFHPYYASVQKTIDRNMPDTINTIASINDSENRLIVHSYSDKVPGNYYLLDWKNKELRFLTETTPGIDPKLMAPMLPMECKTSDNATVFGYITNPVGEKKAAPLVVYIHGGPRSRDEWGFDSWVQFLANRGYAVLQINYRGSTGYGDKYALKRVGDIHLRLPRDIEAGVDWAVANGYADPKRVAVVGTSFGGYAVMHLLTTQPDKYRCGIAIAGVYDWLQMVKDEESGTISGEYWRTLAGDPRQSKEWLKKISVVDLADNVQAPVLLIHGEDDFTVHIKQSKAMAKALKKVGKSVETLYIKNETHYFQRRESRKQLLEAWEKFLAKNMQ